MYLLILLLLLPSMLLSKTIDFVVVIPSYNNEQYVKKNLESLVKQDYRNWELIYINDCSSDKTASFVEKFVKKHRIQKKSTIIHNKERVGAMANIYEAVHLVAPHKVVVLLDGDDELKGNQVLSRVAGVYKNNKNVWLTYGNYEAVPSTVWTNDPCYAFPDAVLKRGSFREFTWICYPLRTFYAKLFHLIKEEDLKWQGKFLPVVSDPGYMFPMLEMAANGHIYFEKKVLYTYRVNNPINDFRVNLPLMKEVSNYIRSLPKYKPLKTLFDKEDRPVKGPTNNHGVDLVVFSFDRPMQLYAFLESCEKHLSNLNQVHAIVRTSNDSYKDGYKIVQRHFPTVKIRYQSDKAPSDFKPLVLSAAFNKLSKSRHVMFAVDDMIITRKTNLLHCTKALERNIDAWFFSLRLGKNIVFCGMLNRPQNPPEGKTLNPQLFKWKFSDVEADGDWNYPNTTDTTIYRKADIQDFLTKATYENPNLLESHWSKIKPKRGNGISFSRSRSINIPLNSVNPYFSNDNMQISTEELLSKFMSGSKIDIDAFYKVNNASPHINYKPRFIAR